MGQRPLRCAILIRRRHAVVDALGIYHGRADVHLHVGVIGEELAVRVVRRCRICCGSRCEKLKPSCRRIGAAESRRPALIIALSHVLSHPTWAAFLFFSVVPLARSSMFSGSFVGIASDRIRIDFPNRGSEASPCGPCSRRRLGIFGPSLCASNFSSPLDSRSRQKTLPAFSCSSGRLPRCRGRPCAPPSGFPSMGSGGVLIRLDLYRRDRHVRSNKPPP